MKEKILEMLGELHPENDYQNSEDFIMDDLLDSFDIVLLCNMSEEEFGIKIDGLDIVPENFNSVEAIVRLVNKSGVGNKTGL